MFHSVKILDAKGKVKKVVSPKSLSQRYWGDFFDTDLRKRNQGQKAKSRGSKESAKIKKQQDLSYDESFFSED